MFGKADIGVLFDQTAKLLLPEVVEDAVVPAAFLNDLSQARSNDQLLQAYAKWARRISKADRCSVALDNGNGKAIKHALDADFDIGKGIIHDLSETAVGEVMQRRKILYLSNLAEVDLQDCQDVSAMGYSAAVLAPIFNDAGCYGTLAISYREPPQIAPNLVAIIQAMANCLATQFLLVGQMEKLSDMAIRDPLTGAVNRYALYDRAKEAWAAWQKDRTPFCYIAIDVDHFKQLNDTYGHDIGDEVLCTLVNRIAGRTRLHDQVVRSGGEEFGLLISGCDLIAATRHAYRLCNAIGASPFVIGNTHLQVTASFGVSPVLPEDTDFSDVLRRADQALYQAKALGRDQVVTDDGKGLAA